MRRSAAPSQLSAKRPRFASPSLPTNDPGHKFDQNTLPKTNSNQTEFPPAERSNGERSTRDILRLISSKKEKCGSQGVDGQKAEQPVEHPAELRLHGALGSDTGSAAERTNGTNRNGSPLPLQASSLGRARGDSADTNLSPVITKTSTKYKPQFGTLRKPAASVLKVAPLAEQNQPAIQHSSNSTHQSKQGSDDEPKSSYYNVIWCKRSNKKHKKWEGDAIMITKGRTVTLKDTEGKEIGRGSGYKVAELACMEEGQTLCVGGKEIEVMSVLKEEDFHSGKCFQPDAQVSSAAVEPPITKAKLASRPFVSPQLTPNAGANLVKAVVEPGPVGQPRFDPTARNALVLPRPNQTHQWENNKQQLPVIDVVVDPHLSAQLRPHQRAGVVFLYECILGMRNFMGNGAILADEMGLGKTLQCITLIWTLYKQGPYGGRPVVRRAIVITPGSLVKNWMREFRKWLGPERINVFDVGPDNKVEQFSRNPLYPVMIISYEMFVRSIDILKSIDFDLVVCDEGHRLKNTNIKTTSYMMSLSTRRRVVLTGTPVQNDLHELFSIIDFCNPGVLGSSSAFHNIYEAPIVASRQSTSSATEVSLGETRATELNRLTGMFILRRTQDINNKYLPPKVEVVLFCRPTELQVKLYEKLLTSRAVRSCLTRVMCGESAQHLMCIAALKKLCNSPSLIHSNAAQAERLVALQGEEESEALLYKDMLGLYPHNYDPSHVDVTHSGKLEVLASLLRAAHHTSPHQRVVVVSNYTQTLDVLEQLCRDEQYSLLRLDGQTPTGKRQQLVERFNDRFSSVFVFLLSSKAGGVGLNLTGGSRLVLYDIDWNPANDLQAMARVWRDGQRQNVVIYRLLTTGTLEEKMYQRQVSKQGLSGVVVDAKAHTKLHFSPQELKALFQLEDKTLCATHDLMDCDCDKEGWRLPVDPREEENRPVLRPCQLQGHSTSKRQQKNICMSELLEWNHEKGPAPDLNHVDPLLSNIHLGPVTYAFWNESRQEPPT